MAMDKLVAADARLQQFTRSTYVACRRNERLWNDRCWRKADDRRMLDLK
jgi:hypothetical protein